MDDSIPYCTREDVKQAADFKQTARDDQRIDRAIVAASRSIDALCHRRFYPEQDTRYWDWPNGQYARPWRLWLDQNELISVTSASSGGVDIPLDTVLLEPNQYGAPYNQLQIDISSSSGFIGGSTHQRDIGITGLYGYRDDATAIGATAAPTNETTAQLDVDGSASAPLGMGSLIRLADERLLVTGRRQLDTGQVLTADLDVKASALAVPVADTAGFEPGEVMLIDAERMLIVDITSDLIVKRGWDGSTLAAHTAGAAVWAPRRLTVRRGVLGSAAAAHDAGTAVERWDAPALVRQLTIAEALVTAGLESSAYSPTSRTSGSGGTERPVSTGGIQSLRTQVYNAHGRKARSRAV